jgi:arylsulfatase A-like enzyme
MNVISNSRIAERGKERNMKKELNIVLIVADTFRRDHLGCYGNSSIQTPHLDNLAAKAVVFDRCYAASFPTVPARTDLLTGKFSFTHLGWGPLPANEVTLPQLLVAEGGYTTIGIVDTPFYIRNGYGHDRGFDDFIWIRGQRPGLERRSVTQDWRYEEEHFAPTSIRAAEKWIENHYKEKFFLMIDTWDPHEPWDPPGYYVEKYCDNYDGRPSPWPCYWYWKEAGLHDDDLKRCHIHYCGEITMVDRWIGRLLERLESLDLMDKTVVIFTSDHGFYFGEHGMLGKAMMRSKEGGYIVGLSPDKHRAQNKFTMLFRSPETGEVGPSQGLWLRSPIYEEVSRVPLLICVPETKSRRVDAMLSLPDLMPTILELAGLEIPEIVQASSLLPLIRGESKQLHDLIITSWTLYTPGETIRVVDDWERIVTESMPSTITDGDWTLLYATKGEPVELYERVSDPWLEKNVFDDHEAVARDLHTRFLRFLEKVGTSEARLKLRQTF